MSTPRLFLTASSLDDLVSDQVRRMELHMPSLQVAALFGALTVVIIGAFLWARYLRKEMRKPRRRRKDKRPRNPTLAETGGLPPARQDSKPPPPA